MTLICGICLERFDDGSQRKTVFRCGKCPSPGSVLPPPDPPPVPVPLRLRPIDTEIRRYCRLCLKPFDTTILHHRKYCEDCRKHGNTWINRWIRRKRIPPTGLQAA